MESETSSRKDMTTEKKQRIFHSTWSIWATEICEICVFWNWLDVLITMVVLSVTFILYHVARRQAIIPYLAQKVMSEEKCVKSEEAPLRFIESLSTMKYNLKSFILRARGMSLWSKLRPLLSIFMTFLKSSYKKYKSGTFSLTQFEKLSRPFFLHSNFLYLRLF